MRIISAEETFARIQKALLDVREVFSTEKGRNVLELIEQKAKITNQIGVKTHEQYAYLQGMRDLYFWLHTIVYMTEQQLEDHYEKVKKAIERGEPIEDD